MTKIAKRILNEIVRRCIICGRALAPRQRKYCSIHARHTLIDSDKRREQVRAAVARLRASRTQTRRDYRRRLLHEGLLVPLACLSTGRRQLWFFARGRTRSRVAGFIDFPEEGEPSLLHGYLWPWPTDLLPEPAEAEYLAACLDAAQILIEVIDSNRSEPALRDAVAFLSSNSLYYVPFYRIQLDRPVYFLGTPRLVPEECRRCLR